MTNGFIGAEDYLKFDPPRADEVGARVPLTGSLRQALDRHLPDLAAKVGYGIALAFRGRMVVEVGKKVVVKYGEDVDIAEAESIQHVSRRTSIPLPHIIGTHKGQGVTFLIMSFVQGEPLDEVWDTLKKEAKRSISEELRRYFDQLRLLPGTYIGRIGSRPCWDPLFFGRDACGPFATEAELNSVICAMFHKIHPTVLSRTLPRMLKEGHRILFCHADFHPRNVIVKDERVCAIIDWEMAGYYPEHWEFEKAMFGIDWSSDWCLHLQDILKPYLDEYAVSRIYRRVLW